MYKALGGFATNGINMTKLESYLLDGKFVSAQFYAEIEAHPQTQAYKNAFEELSFFLIMSMCWGRILLHATGCSAIVTIRHIY